MVIISVGIVILTSIKLVSLGGKSSSGIPQVLPEAIYYKIIKTFQSFGGE